MPIDKPPAPRPFVRVSICDGCWFCVDHCECGPHGTPSPCDIKFSPPAAPCKKCYPRTLSPDERDATHDPDVILRSIEATIGTLDHSAAFDGDDWREKVASKVAALVEHVKRDNWRDWLEAHQGSKP